MAQNDRGPGTQRRLEAVALALVAALPLIPYFTHLVQHGAERFSVAGDYASLELATRYVTSGRTLLGPYSRFQFNHPGPLWFFLVAPAYALFGGTSTGLYAGACAVNAVCAMSIVGAVRALASRAHAIAVLAVLLAWLAAFGNTCVLPWNPLTVVMPLAAFMVLAALFARGSAPAAIVAAFFAALAMQTHMSSVPAVLGVGAAAILSFALRVRQRGSLRRNERRALAVAGLVLVVAFLPPLVEQMISPEGNLTKLVHFFGSRVEPMKGLAGATRNWAFATSWLPDRLFSAGMLDDGIEPRPMGSGPLPLSASTYTVRVASVFVVAALAAGALAVRRRDGTSAVLVATGLFSSALAVMALRAVVGPDYYYLAFWTTAGTTVGWMGIASAVTKALADMLATRRKILRAAWAAAATALVIAAILTGSLQRQWLVTRDPIPKAQPDIRAAYTHLRERLAREEATPVIHVEGAWAVSLSLLLELTRDGVDVRIVDRDRWILGRQPRAADSAPHPLHVWTRTPYAPFHLASCTERIASSGDVELFASPRDLTRCPEP